jgi:MarR family transcriptional regulator, 2-MHQ and catechol-resistance regulon repressor
MQAISGVHIWLIVMKAFQSMSAYTARALDGSGLGDSDFRVLEALLHKGPLPVNVIGPKVFLTPGSISTAVDRLHERGLVSRTESKTDRRVRVVDLTREGRALIEGVFRVHAKDMEKLAEVLTPAERIHLVKALKKLGKHARDVLDDAHADFEPEELNRRKQS